MTPQLMRYECAHVDRVSPVSRLSAEPGARAVAADLNAPPTAVQRRTGGNEAIGVSKFNEAGVFWPRNKFVAPPVRQREVRK